MAIDGDLKKVSWNASQGIINEISNRRSMANGHFINGNITKAIYTLMAIKQSVIQSFTTEERGKLKDIEDKFNRISKALSTSASHSFNKKFNDAYGSAIKIAFKIYTEYNDLLMDLLESRGYLVGEQSDASRMRF